MLFELKERAESIQHKMKIKLNSTFKSLTVLNDTDFPAFLILTGINGAGKTQLLQAIANKKATVEINGLPAKEVKLFSSGLGEVGGSTFYGSKLERFCIALQSKLSNYSYHKKNSPQLTYYVFDTFFSKAEKQILNLVKQNRKNNEGELDSADRLEIMKNIPPDFIIEEPDAKGNTKDIFQSDLAQIFKRYQILHAKNDIDCYLKDKKGRTDVEALSDAEFEAKHGEPPWVLANEILASANIGYLLTTPEGQGHEDPFTIKLVNQENGLEISFSDLSSGEKVLMSLALALYNSHFERIYPDVLLLDEPDCHLHPSMTGKLLKVIEEVFVRERKVSVIMTTHSPSTVALAHDECLYAMSKTGGRISKQTKDRCIKILTSGVPSLSISYDNRVQVFTESKYDARNLGDLYEALKERVENEISLNFISSGSGGSGSSEQVREIVTLLRRNGNTKIYGVIDWDGKNKGDEFIKVIADERRYSFENLIFDPLLVAIYLIRESHVQAEEIESIPRISYLKIANLQAQEYQSLAIYVIEKVAKALNDKQDDSAVQVGYVGGRSISIPRWYLEMNGHELENSLKTAFPPLRRFRNENDLKSDLIKKAATDYPEFIPVEFFELFNSIQIQHST